ncbi:endonuclease/exonuclease/phosphatase family protein [Flammeovirga aprica]|uniref:Endonuclease/exonuclease/phosphatase n=1 Tax=Flammeovirga aprica JL-4 TaxID=694437 RepID=A0A7X9S0G4_9BACT|nr:endonuclease/exonuclease/phosphatase family protein [Flammeovirga aprica]NME71964.1 endonuclease/exonuclease/phosphatase [Flammeovirga aprica JL-4]
MKQILLKVLYFFLFLIVASLIFFFWAKSPNLEKSEYAKIVEFDNPQKIEDDSIISIISYNIGYLSGMTNNTSVRPTEDFYKGNMDKVLKDLKAYRPNVLALQEIDYGGKRSYYVNQFEVIGKELGYLNGGMTINWDKTYVPFPYFPPSVHFGKMLSGQAILSDYKIVEHERTELARVRSHPYYYSAMYLDRLAERVLVNIGGQEVMIFNVHTEAFDVKTRELHISFLKDWFLRIEEKMPVIMVGDFNSDPTYKEKGVKEFYNDERIGAMCPEGDLLKEGTLTYPTDTAIEQLDFVFFSTRHFELIDWKVLSEFGQVSDHFPVLTKLKLKK